MSWITNLTGVATVARDEIKSLIERLHGVWSTGDLAAIPTVYWKEAKQGALAKAGFEGASAFRRGRLKRARRGLIWSCRSPLGLPH
jgi:hypothetical protein